MKVENKRRVRIMWNNNLEKDVDWWVAEAYTGEGTFAYRLAEDYPVLHVIPWHRIFKLLLDEPE